MSLPVTLVQGSERFNLKNRVRRDSTWRWTAVISLDQLLGVRTWNLFLSIEEFAPCIQFYKMKNWYAKIIAQTHTHTYQDTHLQHSRSCTYALSAHARTHTNTTRTRACAHTNTHTHRYTHTDTHEYTHICQHHLEVCINTYRNKPQLYTYIYKSKQCVICIFVDIHTHIYM